MTALAPPTTPMRAPVGEPPAVQFIAPDRLKVDATYQRSLDGRASQKLVAAIAARWDWRLCVPLLVAARGRDLFIIDGQHRWVAAQERGDIPFLPCAVGQYDSAAEEAALFVAANRRRVAVNRLDLFRAALAGGDPASVTIAALLHAAGLSLGEHASSKSLLPGQVSSTAILYHSLDKKGAEAFGRELAIIGSAFADQLISYSGVIIAAIGKLGIADMDDAACARLLAVLRRKCADEWATIPTVYRARGGTVRATQLFFAIRDELRTATALSQLAPQAVPTLPTRPITPRGASSPTFSPPPTGLYPLWCDQCDRKVTGPEAERCADQFCKSKAA